MSTGFNSGMRNHRVTILNKVQSSERQFGEKTGYRRDGSLWSSFNFTKGTKALREGALDAFDTIFCTGPHVVREVRATEEVYGLPAKKLVEFGYPLADKLIAEGMPRTLVATQLGYENYSNFYRMYQKHLQHAPSGG